MAIPSWIGPKPGVFVNNSTEVPVDDINLNAVVDTLDFIGEGGHDSGVDADTLDGIHLAGLSSASDEGLEIYYSFNSIQGGKTAEFLPDIGINGRHAMLYGSPSITQGVAGKAIVFDNVDDYTSGPYPDSPAYSISFWYKGTTNTAYAPLVVLHRSASAHKMKIALDFGIVKFSWLNISSANQEIIGGVINDGIAHLVCCTYDGTTGRIYIDGHLVESLVQSLISSYYNILKINTNELEVPTSFCGGTIDEFKLYTRALTGIEAYGQFNTKVTSNSMFSSIDNVNYSLAIRTADGSIEATKLLLPEDGSTSGYNLKVENNSGLTADKALTLNVGDANRTINILGTSSINQDVQTTASPTFAAIIVPTLYNTGALTLPNATDTLVGKATTDTLTNKTLTSAKISSASSLNDTNGNELIKFPAVVASAVNEITVTNAVSAGTPSISATGDATDISLNLVPKGTGKIQVGGLEVTTISGTQTLTNKTLTTPVISSISNNSILLTLPTTVDTLVGKATTDTLTNKTLTAPDINGGTVDDVTSLTVANNVDIGNYQLRSLTLYADEPTLAPFIVASTAVVSNLNSDKLDGADLSTDNTLASNSDVLIPSQKAVKGYVDGTTGSNVSVHAGLVTGIHGVGTGDIVGTTLSQALTNKSVNGVTPSALTTGFNLAGGTTSKTLTVNNTLGLSAANDTSTLNISTGGTLGTGAFQAYIRPLVDTTNHTVSGLTTGHVLRASDATTYAFAALQESDIPALSTSKITSFASGVTSTVLSGYAIQSGSITTADTIETAIEKLGNDKHVAVSLGANHGLGLSGQQLVMGTPTAISWTSSNSVTTATHTHTLALNNVLNAQTGISYTLVLEDGGKVVTLDNGGAITLTIPTDASVAFPIGTQIDLIQIGIGQVTVDGSVTINSRSSAKKLSAQYVGACLIKTASNTWVLFGDLSL